MLSRTKTRVALVAVFSCAALNAPASAAESAPLTPKKLDRPVRVAGAELIFMQSEREESRFLAGVLCLTADGGTRGFARFRIPKADQLEQQWTPRLRRIQEYLLGKDARDVEEIWEQGVGKLPNDLLRFTDVALWDLLGREVGRPVHALLGTQRNRIRAYYSKDDAKRFLRVKEESGTTAWKIHAWHWGDARMKNAPINIETASLLRELPEIRQQVGPDAGLILDAHYHYFKGWNRDDIVQAIHAAGQLKFLWVEGLPNLTKNEGRELWTYLRQNTKGIPLENEAAFGDVYAVLDLPADDIPLFDMVTIDMSLAGGFTPAVKLARWSIAHGKAMDVHWPDNYALQLAGATDEKTFPLFEFGVSPKQFQGRNAVKDGYMEIPNTPGMGEHYDWTAALQGALLHLK